MTGDRDVLQLVTDRVTVLMTRRGITEMTRFTPDAVSEKYGLTPAQYPDFAALRGDPSDNLPGIPGVGEKTATKWIAEFGSLAALVDRVDEVKGKAGDALREHLANVLRNRQLTSLVTDLPAETVGAVPGDLLPTAWDREKIHQLFDTLQFTGAPRPPLPDAPARPHRWTVSAPGPAAPGSRACRQVGLRGGDRPARPTRLVLAGCLLRSERAVSRDRNLGTRDADTRLSWPSPPRMAMAPTWTRRPLTEADDRALAAWLADPAHPEVLHDAKGPMSPGRRRLPLAGRACEHGAGGLPGAARQRHLRLWPTSGLALPGRSCARRPKTACTP